MASVSLLDLSIVASHSLPILLSAETQDISATGLSLIVNSHRIDENYGSYARTLKLALQLPNSAVSMEINPVRCVLLQPDLPESGYLLAARIASVGENQTAHFSAYLKSLSDAPAS